MVYLIYFFNTIIFFVGCCLILELYTAGLNLVFQPTILLLLLGAVFLGITIGALPGLTAVMGVAILAGLTYNLPAQAAILTLIGVYLGAVYGGSISATLINIPGTPAAICTTFDAFPMAQRGEAGKALGIATVSSFLGGLFSVIVLMIGAPLLANIALKFTSLELFSIAILGLSIIAYISTGSMLKGLISGSIGLLVATIGGDPMMSYPRFTFGQVELYTGIQFISAMIGLFGATEILIQIENENDVRELPKKISRILPGFSFIKDSWTIIVRSSIIGVIIGAIPGTGATIASIVSYGQQKRLSKNPDLMGKGSVEGIVAAEAANNACTGGAMIPLLSLGIPGDATTAILIGAFLMHGLRPGPALFMENIELVSAIFIGLVVANVFMVVLGLSGAKIFAKMITVPKSILYAVVLTLCFIGSFSVQNSLFDVFIMLCFTVIGFLMYKAGIPRAPLVLALILGPIAETNLRRSVCLYGGGVSLLNAFLSRPIALGILILTIILLVYPFIKSSKKI